MWAMKTFSMLATISMYSIALSSLFSM